MKEKMYEKFEQTKKKLADLKNIKLDEEIMELSNNVESDINNNFVKNIFEVAEKFDKTIEA